MSIFNEYPLRKFYRVIKSYIEHLLRCKEQDVEDKVDRIDSRTSRTKLLRREWAKIVKNIKEWNAVRIKKEIKVIISKIQGQNRGTEEEIRSDLDDFLTLARYKYLETINSSVDVEAVNIGPSNLESFLSYFLEKLLEDDMVTSRQFLNASVNDRGAVIRSCMTDAVEDSIPASIHREILSRKSHRHQHHYRHHKRCKDEGCKKEDHEDEIRGKEDTKYEIQKKEKPKEPNKENPPKKENKIKPPRPAKRRVKDVELEEEVRYDDPDGPSQLEVMRQRLRALEDRDRRIRNKTYEPSGKDCDFELNTNLSTFM